MARMFYGCTNLETAPVSLPALNLRAGAYSFMFHGCKALTAAPDIKAETVQRYSCDHMFYECESMKTPPPGLRAESLALASYSSMFQGCRSLERTPDLRFTKVASYCCGYMFAGCESIATASLKAQDLTNEETASDVYSYMFEGCSGLKSIFTDQTSFLGCVGWVTGVPEQGSFCASAYDVLKEDYPNTDPDTKDEYPIAMGKSFAPFRWTQS
jgi:hypothetical protein